MCFVAGTKVKTFDGDLYPVLSAERFYPTEDVKVYNFRVADWHTYYVSEIGILVHNDKYGPDVARRSESGSKANNKVYFGQQAVSPNFSPQGTFKGASIQSVADSLKTVDYQQIVYRLNTLFEMAK